MSDNCPIKVKLDAMKPWIHEKLTEILGFEDDVVIDYAINQLEETNTPDPKAVQINLTGFLNAKVCHTSCLVRSLVTASRSLPSIGQRRMLSYRVKIKYS